MGGLTVDQRIKGIEAALQNVKFGLDEKEELKEILSKGDNAQTQKDVHEFMKKLEEKYKDKYK